jgi:hypothetical protein
MNSDLLTALKDQALSNIRVTNEYTKLGRGHEINGFRFFTYALLLQGGKIYIGDSSNIYSRLAAHVEMNESSANWVKTHGPVKRILEITYDAPPGAERERFLEYADIFGFENVRGSNWCRNVMNSPNVLDEFKRGQMSHKFMNRDEIRQIELDIRKIVAERQK